MSAYTNEMQDDYTYVDENEGGWGTLVTVHGPTGSEELVMRDTMENIYRRIWEWGYAEAELLFESNRYVHMRRERVRDEHGGTWEGWLHLPDSSAFPGALLCRRYVSDTERWGF